MKTWVNKRMALKLKKLDEEDKLKELKENSELKKQENYNNKKREKKLRQRLLRQPKIIRYQIN